MRICVVVVGTNGDVLPMLALARGLSDAGHTVRFATAPFYEQAVRRAGVDFFPVRGSPQSFFSGQSGAGLRDMTRRPAHFQRFWNFAIAPYAAAHLRDTWDACKGFDTAVCIPWFQAAPSLSEKLDIPCFATTVMPAIGLPTSHFPNPMEDEPADGASGNRRSWKSSLRIVTAPLEQINQWRTAILGLRPQTPMEAIRAYRRTHFLLSYSQAVLPRPDDWPDTVNVTGFWYSPTEPGWQPSEELTRFLDRNPRPLMVGFSSQVARDPKAFSANVIEAVRRSGKSALLLTGWGGLRQTDLPPNMLLQPAIPYDWIVPKLSGFLHHGGCGSMAMCLRHGTPGMALPFGFDQSLWGKQVAALGLGPAPLTADRLDVATLAQSLVQMTEDLAMHDRCRAMARTLREEDGIRNGVRAIEQAMKSHPNRSQPKT